MPGGPIRVRIAPDFLSSAMPRSVRSLRTARYSVMRSLTSSRPAWSLVQDLTRVHGVELLLGALVPRHGDQPVEVGADRARLAGLLAHALEPAELLVGLLAHGLGHAGLGDLGAVLLHDVRGVLAQLALDRLHLLAQEVLALLLVSAGLDVVADATADLQLGQAVALDADRERQALGDVDGLEDLDLLLEGHVGRVADRVGQCTGLGDRAQERADALVGTARLEDLLDDGAVLALELAGAPVHRDGVGCLLDIDAKPAEFIIAGGAGNAAHLAGEGNGASAAGQPHALSDARDRPDLRELRAVTGDEQNALVVADVHGERDVHSREHDRVVERDQQKLGHAGLPFHSHLRIVGIVDAGRCIDKDLGRRS